MSNDDYPLEALLNDEEGVVQFLLNVGTDGRANRCTILESSRSASLDDATCRIMTARTRFLPASGADGRPVEDRVVARIRWRLEGPRGPLCPPEVSDCTQLPFPVAMYRARPLAPLASLVSQAEFAAHARSAGEAPVTRFRLSVGPDGRVTECELLMTSGSAFLDEAACRAMRERARFTPGHDADGQPVSDSHWGHIRWSGLDDSPGPVPVTL